MSVDDGPATFESLISELRNRYPDIRPGCVDTILFDQHMLLFGGWPGDIVPQLAIQATLERLDAIDGRPGEPDQPLDELAS